MKKTNFIFGTVVAMFLLAACNNKPAETTETTTTTPAAAEAATYTVDPATSSVKWKGVMLGVKEHTGTVALKDGSLSTANGQVTGGNFTVDLGTIIPTDSAYNAQGTKEKLVGHLSSPDFFDVANNPTATFTITSVNGTEVKGTLTVRGKSNEETVKNITLTEADGTVNATGTLVFDRKKYGVAFDMPMKDMVISNDIEIQVSLTGAKAAQ